MYAKLRYDSLATALSVTVWFSSGQSPLAGAPVAAVAAVAACVAFLHQHQAPSVRSLTASPGCAQDAPAPEGALPFAHRAW